MASPTLTLAGGGLVGALLAHLLARAGFDVEVFEKRPDPRRAGYEEGRSINLALAERGLHALRSGGLAEQVLARAVMMRGRMVHVGQQTPSLQRYGVDDSEVIWSVSRGALNMLILDAAEVSGVRFHFGHVIRDVDFDRQRLYLVDASGAMREHAFDRLIGADGAGSAVRAAMNRRQPLGERVEALGHAYKELEIPPVEALSGAPASTHGHFALEPHALHIWPRGGHMCIALPNPEGSFTVTLFLPGVGPHPSFATLPDADSAERFFRTEFPDLLPLMPRFAHDFAAHPAPNLYTLYLDRWHLGERAVLLGDAAHAIVPFHGQGMNCGLEDAVELAALLASDRSGDVFETFQQRRKPNADAIAAMALENYIEMRDSVTDPRYLDKRELGARLAEAAPAHFMVRYRMVTFTSLPYAYAYERGTAQDALLDRLLAAHGSAAAVPMEEALGQLRISLPPLPAIERG
ncbi:FAD-dependent oxidoreductase [Dyella sp. KULCS107]|uniref:FAD-dependent oxidoreductase n=1 Tax=Dyella sp. KULCS107 TaxID=3422216 RepID=UPI003D6EE772